MGSLSNYAENKLLDHLFNAAYTPAATLYLALCTADPTDAATGAAMNEVTNANNYARISIGFDAAATRRVTQAALLTFNTASGPWGIVSHYTIVDSPTHGAGNVLAHGQFSATHDIVINNTPTIADTEVWVEFSAGYISTAVAHKLLDLMFRNIAYAKPATYVALCTAVVADTSTGSTITEPVGNNYSRVLVNINGGASPTWTLAAGGALDNVNAINMPTPSAAWGTIVAAAICSAATLGDVLVYDNGVTDQAVGTNDAVSFPVGALDVTLA